MSEQKKKWAYPADHSNWRSKTEGYADSVRDRCAINVPPLQFGEGFADSLVVFATPKRIGLKSNCRPSGVLVNSSPITSPRRFSASLAGLKKPVGLNLR